MSETREIPSYKEFMKERARRNRQICRQYGTLCLSMPTIAKLHGISTPMVSRILKRMGVPRAERTTRKPARSALAGK